MPLPLLAPATQRERIALLRLHRKYAHRRRVRGSNMPPRTPLRAPKDAFWERMLIASDIRVQSRAALKNKSFVLEPRGSLQRAA